MPSPIRGSTLQHRELLASGWEFCGVPPDSAATPAELSGSIAWLKTTVPCTAASALRELGLWSIESPLRRFDAEDWWFRCEFSVTHLGEQCVLGFDGLATLAEVWLNDVKILASESMFLAHEVDVTGRLKLRNFLYLRFRSLDKALAAKRPRPRWKAPMIENQQLRWFRTTVLGRTPGWSPSAAAVGPWRPVWIERRDALSAARAQVRTSIDGENGIVECDVQLASSNSSIAARLIVTRGEHSFTETVSIEATHPRAHVRLVVPQVKRWWPHTHGEPSLYIARLELEAAEDLSHAIDLGHIGFRTVRVDTTNGQFRVFVNEVPIFCRGACWTPIDPISLRANTAEYERAIEQVSDAGMNMIRIAGTMVYEDEVLLDACDRRGILVWQEFMFANMDFPHGDASFDCSVEHEVRQVLNHVAPHPSLAVLCGNSEVEQQAAMFGATRDRWTPALFHQFIPQLVREICPDVPYWPSSAHGGSFPHQPNVGTTSYYGVGAYLRPLEDARRSEVQFASECLAFANIPEDATLAKMPKGLSLRVHHPEWKARTPRDLGAGWDFEDVRDHYVKELFGVDVLALRYSDHDRYLQLGRIATANVMAATFAEWRRKRSACSGGLVWFLRDLIPGAGWGIIDAFGEPKAAYYALRRALKPAAVFMSDEGCNGLAIHVVNDKPEPIEGCIHLSAYRGSTTVAHAATDLAIPAHGAHCLMATDLADGFRDFSNAYRFGPAVADVVVVRLTDRREHTLAEHFHFVHALHAYTADDLGLTATARQINATDFEITLRTERFAHHVRVDAQGYTAPDQYFHLAPGSSRVFTLHPRSPGIPMPLRASVLAANCPLSVPITVQ